MKGKLIFGILLIAVCVFLVGCGKKEEEKVNIVGGWTIDGTKEMAIFDDDALAAFKRANDKDYKLVALLGKQVVAGTNYMFLVKDNGNYKTVVVYNNLENKSTITSVSNFDITKYVNEDISYKDESVVGGWYVDIPSGDIMIDSEIQSIFNEAMEKIQGADYKPLGVLAHQAVSGTNYAVLAYGRINTTEENSGVYILTLYKDLNGTSEIVSSAYVDLADFNK